MQPIEIIKNLIKKPINRFTGFHQPNLLVLPFVVLHLYLWQNKKD